MTFIIPDKFPKDLMTIRKVYEKRIQTDLSTATQPWAVSCFFGATDVLARKNQITLIETIYKTQLSQFFNADGQLLLNDTSHENDINAYFDGLRILMAATFYIKSEINAIYWVRSATNSKLFNLIDDALALPEGNLIDEPTRNCVLATTEAFMNRTTVPQILDKDLIALNAEPEWKKFKGFIAKQCTELKITPTNYPITQFLMPIFSKPFELAGYAVGWTLGEFVAQANFTQRNRLNLTGGLGDLLYTLAGGGSVMAMGVGFVAPTIAQHLFAHYAEINLAWLLGATMSLIGQGAGVVVGVPLDMTYRAACYAVASLYSTNGKPLPPISGFNLVNGDYYDKGIRIQTMEENQAIEQVALQIFNSTKLNSTEKSIEIKVVDAPEDTATIPRDLGSLSENQQAMIQELKTALEERGLLPSSKQIVKAEQLSIEAVEEEVSDYGYSKVTCA